MERQRENSPQIPYSFPMANGTHKRNPYPGVSLFCVGSNTQCRDTLPPNPQEKKLPVLYGSTVAPSGFVGHNTEDCPVPRISTFESLEAFWAQDFLQTFMDCLKDSDFTTSSAQDLGVDNAYIFNDSTRQSVNTDTYNNSFPYQCCFYPSFYQAAVRGQQQLTLYFNPLFSSQYDYNCHLEDDCLGHGSVNITSNSSNTDLKKATPHSSHWYLLNSLALLETQSTQVQFWKNHEVGTTHTRDEVSQQLFGTTYGLLGDPALEEAAQTVIGSHYTAAKVYNSDPLLKLSQNRLHDVANIFCPTRPTFSTYSKIDRFHAGIKQPHHNYITYRYLPTSVDLQSNNQQIPPENFNSNFFDSPLPNDRGANDPEFKLQTKLACCVRDIPSTELMYFQTMSRYFTPGVGGGGPTPTTTFSTTRFFSIEGACEPFLCPSSPICHNLLLNYCSSSLESHSSQYCRRWHSWASANYGPKTTNVIPKYLSWTSQDLPWGAHNVGVDTSMRALLSACSKSLALGATATSLYKDMCQGFFSTTYQTNFPRLHSFEWGDAIEYGVENVFPYYLDDTDSVVVLQLSYARYEQVYKGERLPGPQAFSSPFQRYCWKGVGYPNFLPINWLLRKNIDAPYIYMPNWTSKSLANLSLGSIRELDFTSFYTRVENAFNESLKISNGNFTSFPDPALVTFTQTLTSKIGRRPPLTSEGDQIITVTPFNPDHKTDLVSLVNKTFTVIHSTKFTGQQRRSAYDIYRLEDPNFLYLSQTNLQIFGGPSNRQTWPTVTWPPSPPIIPIPNSKISWTSATTLYNSMFDVYDAGNGNYSWTMCGSTSCYNYNIDSSVQEGTSYLPGPSLGLATYNDPNDRDKFKSFSAVVPEGVYGKTAPLLRYNAADPYADIVPVFPEMKLKFSEKLAYYLNLPSTESVVTMSSITVEANSTNIQSFSVTLNAPGLLPFPVRNSAKFYITNSSNIDFRSISVLNPFPDYFSVSLNSVSLNPGSRSLCQVKMLNVDTNTQAVSLTMYPILFFDSFSWQASLSNQDFPVLGGFYACQTFDDALIKNDFAGNRFSQYVVDPNLENPTDPSYLSNQSIYPRGAVPITARNLTIVPLV